MKQRELRKLIFAILFEKELMLDIDVDERINEVINENNLSRTKKEFLNEYIKNIIYNEDYLIKEISKYLKGWSYNTIGTTEKVILKMSFYEILIKKIGYQIAINEALLLTVEYGDLKSKEFINGILADIVN